MMIRTLASLALLAAACLPAAAEYDASANINAAFAQGKAIAEPPQTANEKWTCSAFCYVWSDLAVDEFGEAMVINLDPALSEAAAREASAHREKQAVLEMGRGVGELCPQTELYIELQTDKARERVEGVVWGAAYDLVTILGQCAVPAGE